MPYLTPQELPESDDCRSLSIPANSEWLALFGGALTELTKSYNWEDSGGLTIDETLEKMNEIINAWYSEPCADCELPGGGRVIRIGEDGEIEELVGGEWVEPSGDYVIPSPEAREDGTEADQICLASKNAVNVLEQLYESLSESFADNLSTADALIAFAAAALAIIGFEFAPITFGIAAFLIGVFEILYQALAYLTADLWDEDFTNQMVCFLQDCASNDAGVVTFDWDCFVNHLNSLADSFELSEVQLRLYLQVSYILYFIGGVKGLNLAGGTTEITNDDCDFCDTGWCHYFDFTVDDFSFHPYGFSSTFGTYVPGSGFLVHRQNDSCSDHNYLAPESDFDVPSAGASRVKVYFSSALSVPTFGAQFNYLGSGTYSFSMGLAMDGLSAEGFASSRSLSDNFYVGSNACGVVTDWYITALEIEGDGDDPFPDADPCPE